MDHFESPRNSTRMESPDLVGLAGTPGRGQFLAIYLRVKDGVVDEASYQCNGCGVTIAVGSMLTEMIRNRPVA